jgi:hypothetical protein
MRALLLALLLPMLALAEEPTTQLLTWSGALPLLQQAAPVATLALQAEAQQRGASPAQQARWQRRLGNRFEAGLLQQRLIAFVAPHQRAAEFSAAVELLQRPLAKRVRSFEASMARAGALEGLQQALIAPVAVDATRLALVREIDAAVGESRRVALLQTLVARRVQQLVGAPAPVELAQEVEMRRRHLAPLTEAWLLHAYRNLNTEELQGYLDLWRQPALQWLQQLSLQGLEAALSP